MRVRCFRSRCIHLQEKADLDHLVSSFIPQFFGIGLNKNFIGKAGLPRPTPRFLKTIHAYRKAVVSSSCWLGGGSADHNNDRNNTSVIMTIFIMSYYYQ